MGIGAGIVIVGTIMQGLSDVRVSLAQFMLGRCILVFGVTIASDAGPMYVVEVSHPAHRGVITAS